MSVRDFASPTLRTLRGGSAITNLDEFTEEVINAGLFFQEQISLDNRLFLTAGARLDGNSAFGEDFGLEWYPKAGLSWVVSDHGFFNVPLVNELRVRGAFGTSGLQPGAFDSQRTWRPTAFLYGPAVAPLNQGNPNLKPERSTELELALEASLFDGRLGFEFIYFDQETTDALLPAFPPPSTGFQSSQLRNLGRITTNGVEIATNFRAMERSGLRWDLNASYSYTDQIVADMGGVPDFRLQTRYRWGHIAEGYAPGAVITPVADPNQPYIVTVPIEELSSVAQILPNTLKNSMGGDSLVWVGNPQPKWTVNFGSSLQLGDNLSLRALLTGGGGDYILSYESGLIRTATASNLLVAEVQSVLQDPNATVEARRRAAEMYGLKHPDLTSNWMEDGDYLALQEVSLIYQLPDDWLGRLGLENTSVSVGGRNLHVWTGYSGIMDPGAAPNGWPAQAGVFSANIDYMSSPSTRRFTMSLRTSW
ncbi:MAG: TonB-dependent receptor [Gemmatimonadota bacterium]